MKSWLETSHTNSNQHQPSDWIATLEKYLSETNPEHLTGPYKTMFLGIKGKHFKGYWTTQKQFDAVKNCWRRSKAKQARRYGISNRSFRGLPRVVNEGIY
jgi:hypothetical protein